MFLAFFLSSVLFFLLSLSPSLSLSLSFFLGCLLASSFLFICLFLIQFFFLSFFIRWIPDVRMVSVALYSFCFFLSHQFRFYFFSVNSYFLVFAPVGLFSDSLFSAVFLLCFQPSFFLSFGFFSYF